MFDRCLDQSIEFAHELRTMRQKVHDMLWRTLGKVDVDHLLLVGYGLLNWAQATDPTRIKPFRLEKADKEKSGQKLRSQGH